MFLVHIKVKYTFAFKKSKGTYASVNEIYYLTFKIQR